MEPYSHDTLPLESIDWIAHILHIGKANAALARYDGILRGMVNPHILRLYGYMKQKVPEITRSKYAILAIDAIFSRPIFQSVDLLLA